MERVLWWIWSVGLLGSSAHAQEPPEVPEVTEQWVELRGNEDTEVCTYNVMNASHSSAASAVKDAEKAIEPAWIAEHEHILVQLEALIQENNALVDAHDAEVQVVNDLIDRYPDGLPDAEYDRAMGLKASVTSREAKYEALQGEIRALEQRDAELLALPPIVAYEAAWSRLTQVPGVRCQ